jgi:hypothetical protein
LLSQAGSGFTIEAIQSRINNRTPEDLIRFWLGHAGETVTDGYSKLAEDVEYRKEVAAEVGLDFEISAQEPVVVPNVPSFTPPVAQKRVAQSTDSRECAA